MSAEQEIDRMSDHPMVRDRIERAMDALKRVTASRSPGLPPDLQRIYEEGHAAATILLAEHEALRAKLAEAEGVLGSAGERLAKMDDVAFKRAEECEKLRRKLAETEERLDPKCYCGIPGEPCDGWHAGLCYSTSKAPEGSMDWLRAKLAEAEAERDRLQEEQKHRARMANERSGYLGALLTGEQQRTREARASLRDLLEAAKRVAGVSWCSEREAVGIPNAPLKKALDSLRAAIARAEEEAS